jgi:hypothetical protein
MNRAAKVKCKLATRHWKAFTFVHAEYRVQRRTWTAFHPPPLYPSQAPPKGSVAENRPPS